MINTKIVTLSNFLRNDGMIVSIRSTTTASWIWENYHQKLTLPELKEILRCVYVKNKEDFIKYDHVFDLLFPEIKVKPKKKEKKPDQRHRDLSEVTDDEVVQRSDLPQPNQEELNHEMIEERKQKKIITNKLVDDNILLLDNYDSRVFDICRRLSIKIANQRSKRRRLAHSHKIDMPRTIRSNLKNGGHLIKLFYQKPPLKKTKQIFLSDVSGSCEWVSTWFFAILYGCYKTFDKVTVYDFDNKIVDITETLKYDYENTGQILNKHRSLGIRAYGQSDMAAAFKQVLDEVELNKHTDVILLTDCRDWNGERNNGVLESAMLLHQIFLKSRKVIILNPEKKIRWNNQTSCVEDYEKAGAEIYETGTLDQFANVISKL